MIIDTRQASSPPLLLSPLPFERLRVLSHILVLRRLVPQKMDWRQLTGLEVRSPALFLLPPSLTEICSSRTRSHDLTTIISRRLDADNPTLRRGSRPSPHMFLRGFAGLKSPRRPRRTPPPARTRALTYRQGHEHGPTAMGGDQHGHETTTPALGQDGNTSMRTRRCQHWDETTTPMLEAGTTMTTVASNIEHPWDDDLDHAHNATIPTRDDSNYGDKHNGHQATGQQPKYCNEDEDPSPATRR
ncbi:hypothetical protein BDZ89DRAFT_1046765 [Hymenopellis radicata]|nr:hypothetical protein BDZ89DRAFT_1046765 [Hymenopellis radicata]